MLTPRTSHPQLLTVKEEIDEFKKLSKKLDAEEGLDFYLDIQEYQVPPPLYLPVPAILSTSRG